MSAAPGSSVRHWRAGCLFTFLIAIAGGEASATIFVVPQDRDLIRRADAIVVGSALSSYAQLSTQNAIETVTPLSIEETIKGDVTGTINVVEPGGQLGRRMTLLAGVPRFEEGKRMLLLLNRTGADRWAVSELVLGKFSFENDINGHALLVRDEAEIVGWDATLQPHREQRRLAGRFLDFVRAEARGQTTPADYWTDVAPLRVQRNATTSATRMPATAIAPYTATSYTMLISGSLGARWAVFPSAVSWFSGTTQEPGAPGGGVTAIQAAISSWDNDCGSNVNYVYAGVDDGTHTQGLHGVDGRNTVLFERDLSSWGISPFTCSANGYSGTLGIGGITSASGQNSVNGETFATTNEGDVEMNRGIANCTLLFNNGDFNSAVTHEMGHTLGFRHSDQDRGSSAACTSDPSLECSNQAIMKSFITTGLNAALQAWDQHAVQAVYPGNVCNPSCTPPAITQQPSSTTITAGGSATLSVSASGTAPLSYQWYIGTSGTTTSPIPGSTGASVTVSPTTTTSYWVQVTNSCGTANSNTATVTVTSGTPTASSFFLVTPCRIIDTRTANGPRGGPSIGPGGVRNINVAGVCSIPAQAKSLALNVTVVPSSGNGWLTLFPGPASTPVPFVSTINYSTRVLANNTVVLIGSDGTINVYNSGPSTVNFLIDVNGFFQ
jgi:Ig-like domain CHU_C associated